MAFISYTNNAQNHIFAAAYICPTLCLLHTLCSSSICANFDSQHYGSVFQFQTLLKRPSDVSLTLLPVEGIVLGIDDGTLL